MPDATPHLPSPPRREPSCALATIAPRVSSCASLLLALLVLAFAGTARGIGVVRVSDSLPPEAGGGSVVGAPGVLAVYGSELPRLLVSTDGGRTWLRREVSGLAPCWSCIEAVSATAGGTLDVVS